MAQHVLQARRLTLLGDDDPPILATRSQLTHQAGQLGPLREDAGVSIQVPSCSRGRSSAMCCDWPCTSTSCSPSSCRIVSGTLRPLTRAPPRAPLPAMSRLTISVPSSGSSPYFVDDCLKVRREHAAQDEHAFDHRSFGATADHVWAESIPKERADGVDQDRLAGAGLAGDDVQPRPPLDMQVIDRGEVADRQLLQHPALIITGAASG